MAQVIQQLNSLECADCGMTFAITADFEQRRRQDHKAFYCPNGHHLSYGGQNDKDRIRKLEQQLNDRNQYADRLLDQRNRAERSALGYKGAAVRARGERDRIVHRVHAGVCPHCHRTFQQLARHMESKHAHRG